MFSCRVVVIVSRRVSCRLVCGSRVAVERRCSGWIPCVVPVVFIVLIRSAWLSVAPGSKGFVAHFPVWKALTVAIVVPRLDLQGESDCSDFLAYRLVDFFSGFCGWLR